MLYAYETNKSKKYPNPNCAIYPNKNIPQKYIDSCKAYYNVYYFSTEEKLNEFIKNIKF